jgi:hypothetical protein
MASVFNGLYRAKGEESDHSLSVTSDFLGILIEINIK